MRFRDGTLWQQSAAVALGGAVVLALAAVVQSEALRHGMPNPAIAAGRVPGTVVPLRADAHARGVRRTGIRFLALNGVPAGHLEGTTLHRGLRRTLGATNDIVIVGPDGEPRELRFVVTPHAWRDSAFVHGPYVGPALLIACIGIGAFLRRPFTPPTWSILIGAACASIALTAPALPPAQWSTGLLALARAGVAVVPWHWTLTLPVDHRLRRRRPALAVALYAFALPLAGVGLYGLDRPDASAWRYAAIAGPAVMGVGMLAFLLRSAAAAGGHRNPLVRQRARVTLAGALLTGAPLGAGLAGVPAFAALRPGTGPLWPLALLPCAAAMAAAAVQYTRLDARRAARMLVASVVGGAGLGAATAGVLRIIGPFVTLPSGALPSGTELGVLALLLVPVVLFWPHIARTVEPWVAPERRRLPAAQQRFEEALAVCGTPEAALDVLATAPKRVCATDAGAAFLLAGVAGPRTLLRNAAGIALRGSSRLAREPLVRTLMARRARLTREEIDVNPQLCSIADDLRTGFDRLDAAALVPICRAGDVIGGIAAGPRPDGRPHDAAALALLERIGRRGAEAAAALAADRQASPKDRDTRRRPGTVQAIDVEAEEVVPPAGPAHADGAEGWRAAIAALDAQREAATPERDTQPSRPALPAGVPQSITGSRYRVVRPLGEGGYKRVYLALDTMLDRRVALALIKPEALKREGRQRIRREAQAMAQLGDHPNIVNVYDMGEVDGQVFLVNQFMPGGALRARIAAVPDRRIPIADAIRVADEIGDALYHAHTHGIVHRDLKPGNIWLTGDDAEPAHAMDSGAATPIADPAPPLMGGAKLGDFGLAFRQDQTRLTERGIMMGTVSYMAPEQVRGDLPAPAWDLYALGVVLYEMLAGRRPFRGENSVAIAYQHLHRMPRPPSHYNPRIPPELDTLVLQLLAKTAAERPRSAAEVREAIQALRF